MIEFDYRGEKPKTGEVIFRPIAKVYLLTSDGNRIAELFYIDSGADYTLIPYRMGRFLRLESIAGEIREIGGIGGVIGARFAPVPMIIGEHEFACTIAWAQLERVPMLLGRKDVFDLFDVTFKQRLRKVFFEWKREKK